MTALTILQLDTHFPRAPGDVACLETYREDIEILRVPGAGVSDVVRADPMALDIAPFEEALTRARGRVITTSCGFLAPWQAHLQSKTAKPLVASALAAFDHLAQDHAPGEVMIVTYSAESLTKRHLGRHGAHACEIIGLPETCELRQVIAEDRSHLDGARAQADVSDLVARHLRDRHRAIVFECTNLPPYAGRVRAETHLPVFDILSELERREPGLVSKEYL